MSNLPTMITLTDTAVQKVGQLLADEGAAELALRVAVKSGGCSGFSYDMYFDGDIASDDITVTYGNVKVVVDPASAPMLQGASLDYKFVRLRQVVQLTANCPTNRRSVASATRSCR